MQIGQLPAHFHIKIHVDDVPEPGGEDHQRHPVSLEPQHHLLGPGTEQDLGLLDELLDPPLLEAGLDDIIVRGIPPGLHVRDLLLHRQQGTELDRMVLGLEGLEFGAQRGVHLIGTVVEDAMGSPTGAAFVVHRAGQGHVKV